MKTTGAYSQIKGTCVIAALFVITTVIPVHCAYYNHCNTCTLCRPCTACSPVMFCKFIVLVVEVVATPCCCIPELKISIHSKQAWFFAWVVTLFPF